MGRDSPDRQTDRDDLREGASHRQGYLQGHREPSPTAQQPPQVRSPDLTSTCLRELSVGHVAGIGLASRGFPAKLLGWDINHQSELTQTPDSCPECEDSRALSEVENESGRREGMTVVRGSQLLEMLSNSERMELARAIHSGRGSVGGRRAARIKARDGRGRFSNTSVSEAGRTRRRGGSRGSPRSRCWPRAGARGSRPAPTTFFGAQVRLRVAAERAGRPRDLPGHAWRGP